MADKQIAMTHDADSCKPVSRAKEKCNWVIKLLRVPFHEYRTTLSDEERLQWLAAHFFVNRASSALYVENVIGKKGILRLLIREGEEEDRATMKERQAHWDGVNPQGVLG
ncbi:uncharacterized protein [Rutidosis leptorrhynchoides]|uniref:uncharacterized protein n=1 Tax=Rutidosis leptorrhynchoides TaxID=125765 RepID=UPI003A9961D7